MGKIIRVSMVDIARRAGVCQATVSLALRNHESIPRRTRERIAKISGKMGYEPNSAVSTLMARVRLRRPVSSRGALGAITSWPDRKRLRDTFTFHAFYKGAKARAAELGYDFQDFWLPEPGMTPRRVSTIIRARGIEGVLVFPLTIPARLDLDWENLAGATMGYTLQWPPLHRAAADQYEAVIIALHNLRSRGYARIGLAVDAQINERVKRKWVAAFCAYQLGSQAMSQDLVILLGGDREAAFASWVKRQRPDAIIFGEVPAHEWIERMGRRAPDDLGLVGLSAVYRGDDCAHIDERSDLVGAAAVDLVVAQLHRNERGIPGCQHELFIMGRWIEGKTVRPAASP